MDEFLTLLVEAMELPDIESIDQIDASVPFSQIKDFDSLATLAVMTVCEVDYDFSIEGQWLWDDNVTPNELYAKIASS
jgi:acyl carrier protein